MTEEEALAIALAAAAKKRKAQPSVWENVWGKGEIDTPGERAGAYINKLGQSFVPGMGRGTTSLMDLPGAAFNYLGSKAADAVEAGYEATTGRESPEFFDAARRSLQFGPMGSGSTARDAARTATAGGIDYVGESLPERIAGTAGEMFPATVGAGANAFQYALAPAAASEVAADAVRGKTIPEAVPLVGGQDAEPYARIGATLAAPAGISALKRVATPFPANPERLRLADKLDDEGVRVTAGQRTGSETLKRVEEFNPRLVEQSDETAEAFTAAVMRRIGSPYRTATPEAIKEAKTRIGGMFDDLAARNNVRPDRTLLQSARGVVDDYEKLTNKNTIAPIVRNIYEKIERFVGSGRPIPGDEYQSMRSDLGKMLDSNDSNLVMAAKGLQSALDDAMSRTLAASGNTDDIALYAQARQQWRDFLAIRQASTMAGQDTALGVISPSNIRQRVVSQGREQYAEGTRELGELARAGEATMKPLGQSGTTPSMLSQMVGGQSYGPAFAFGLAADAMGATGLGSVGSAMIGATVPAVRNAFVGSPAGQRFLANQVFTKSDPRGLLALPLASQLPEMSEQK